MPLPPWAFGDLSRPGLYGRQWRRQLHADVDRVPLSSTLPPLQRRISRFFRPASGPPTSLAPRSAPCGAHGPIRRAFQTETRRPSPTQRERRSRRGNFTRSCSSTTSPLPNLRSRQSDPRMKMGSRWRMDHLQQQPFFVGWQYTVAAGQRLPPDPRHQRQRGGRDADLHAEHRRPVVRRGDGGGNHHRRFGRRTRVCRCGRRPGRQDVLGRDQQLHDRRPLCRNRRRFEPGPDRRARRRRQGQPGTGGRQRRLRP